MKINEIIVNARSQVRSKADGALAVEVLLGHCLKISRERLYLSDNLDVTDADVNRFRELLERFVAGEPVAYLVGNKEFFGLDFFVDRRVLTPRPETEILVENVISFAKGRGKLKILDVGTGSGNIALALAKNLDEAVVHGCDLSREALEVAEMNAVRNGLENKVKFFQSDLLADVDENYDIVAANLPYIGTEKNNFISANVKDFEPHIALFGGSDGLELYEKLFFQQGQKSWKPKLLAGEFGFAQADAVKLLINKYFPSADVFLIDDYASIPRVFMVNFS